MTATVTLGLAVSALLFVAGMAGWLDPTSRVARIVLAAALGPTVVAGGAFALAWFVALLSLIF